MFLSKNKYIFAKKQFMSEIIVPGEPIEVTQIRNKILNTFNELVFIEEGHQYFLRGEELQSVSHVTHQFQPQSDWEAIATNYAFKHGETKEYWQEQWHYNSLKATIRGTLTHEYGESIAWLRNGFPEKICPSCKCKYVEKWLVPTHPKEEAILKFWDELHPNLHFVLAETKVYSGVNPDAPKLSKNYAGTFDLLFYYKDPVDDNKSGLVIYDYKGLPLDTPILTTDGWKTMGNVQEDDYVFDKNGKPTKVLHASSIHHNPCYKITFDTDEIIADCDHRWEVSFINGKDIENKVMTTLEIKDYIDKINNNQIKLIPKIMINKSLDVENQELLDDLSDVVKWLSNPKISEKDFFNVLCKFSTEKRYEILQKFMASHGYYDNKSNIYTIIVNNNKKECVMLLSSLGIKAYVDGDVITFKNKLLIEEKDNFREIISVEEVDTVPTRCIEVESDTHTFCCGYNMLVTHNTNKELIKDYSRSANKMLLPPFENFYDEAQSLYTLQLSCYQIPLEDIGLKVIGRRLIHLKEDGTYEKIPLKDVTKELRNTL